MIGKIHHFLLRPWLLAGIATVVLTGPAVAQQWTHDPNDWGGSAGYGPNAWSDVFSCGGLTQSPVDIPASIPPQSGSPLVFDYQDVDLVVTNTGNVIEVVVPAQAGGTLSVGGEVYQLERIQFHVGAEHLMAGQQAAMEAHLVHSNALGQVAIVAVWMEVGTPLNNLVDQILSNAPATVGSGSSLGLMNARHLLPDSTVLLSSVETTIEYSPLVYSPLTSSAMSYTQVGFWNDRDHWKANWKKWKKALRSFFDRDDDHDRHAEKDARKAAKKAAKAAKKAAKEAARQARWEEKKARWEERREARRAERLARREAERKDKEGENAPPDGDAPPPDGDTPPPAGDNPPPPSTVVQVASYYEYTGSLTMPTCDNSVRWFVLKDTLSISSQSVADMNALVAAFPNYDGYQFNNRPVQGLFGRTVLHIQ